MAWALCSSGCEVQSPPLSVVCHPLFRPLALLFIDVRDQSRRQYCEEVQRSSAEAELITAAQSSRPQQQQDEEPFLPIL